MCEKQKLSGVFPSTKLSARYFGLPEIMNWLLIHMESTEAS